MPLHNSLPKVNLRAAYSWPVLHAKHRLMGTLAALAAALVLSACGGSNPAPNDFGDQGGSGLAAVTAATPVTFLDGTFAGKTSNADMFAAVVTHATGIEAYFCDGKRSFWFRGLASESTIEMTEASGAKLTIDVAKDIAVGQLTVGDVVTTFELPSAPSDSLFRADTNVGSSRVLAGWIKLPNGEQRGVIRNGAVSLPSTLIVAAAPALPKPVCVGCDAFVAALVVAPFTPAAAQVRPNVPQTFAVIGLGDGLIGGEGAPLTAAVPGVSRATWTSGSPFSSNRTPGLSQSDEIDSMSWAAACHRGISGLQLAIDDLWPTLPFEIDVIHKNNGCSGTRMIRDEINFFGRVDTSVLDSRGGPAQCWLRQQELARLQATPTTSRDDIARLDAATASVNKCFQFSNDIPFRDARFNGERFTGFDRAIPRQIDDVAEFVSSPNINRRLFAIDAVVMSMGSSDLGFGDVIADCLAPGNCSAAGRQASNALSTGLTGLPRSFGQINSGLNFLGVTPGNVYLTSHPSPIQKSATAQCVGSDLAPDALLANLSPTNARFVTSFYSELNNQIAGVVAARGWKPITSHLSAATGRSMCSPAPWFNTRLAALALQGEDHPNDNPPGVGLFSFKNVIPLVAPVPVNISAGMFHPNAAGQREGYMPAYRAVLEEAVVTRFTPRAPTRIRPVAFFKDSAGNTSVEVTWDDVNDFESSTVISATGARPSTTTNPKDAPPRARVALGAAGTGTINVKACLDRPTTTALCSSPTQALVVEAKVPTQTPGIVGNAPFVPTTFGVAGTATSHRITWADAAPSKLWSTVEIDTAGAITRLATEGQTVLIPFTKGLKRFRVAACNTLGCGPATAWTDFIEPTSAATAPTPCLAGERLIKARCEKDNLAKS